MNERLQAIGLIFVLFVTLVGCSRCMSGGVPASDLILQEELAPSIAAPEAVSIYYDGTPSMRGFLADERYRRLVTHSVSYAAGSSLPVQYIQASNQGQRGILHAMASSNQAGRTELYLRGDSDVRTVVDSASTDHLNVIITDFFETNQELPQINRTIAQRFLRQGHAVGLIGARYQFEGLVYDVGLDLETFRYDGLRPLYILVIGEPEAVVQYMKALSFDGVDTHQSLFSPQLLESQITGGKVRVSDAHGMVEANILNVDIPNQFILRSSRGATSTMRLDMPVTFTGGDASRMNVEALLDQVQFVPDCAEEGPIENARALSAATTSSSLNNGLLAVDFSLDQGARLDKGVYRFDIRLPADVTTRPDWVNDWTMDLSALPGWLSDPASFDGSRTQYLNDFVDRLTSDIQEIQQPNLGHIPLYIKYEG